MNVALPLATAPCGTRRALTVSVHAGMLRPIVEPSGASDAELARLVLAARGDARSAEAELCARFAPRVRLYGLRHLRSEDAAADLVQQVLIITIQKLRRGEVREPEQIASFVLGVARRVARDFGRAAHRTELADPEVVPAVAAAIRDPEPLAADHLARCVGELGERERTVVLMTFYQEQSAAEIATALDVKEGNVRVMRHRALARLRTCMGLDEGAS